MSATIQWFANRGGRPRRSTGATCPLQEPPTLPESVGGGGNGMNMLYSLPMMAELRAMMLMIRIQRLPIVNSPLMFVRSGIMGGRIRRHGRRVAHASRHRPQEPAQG